MMTRGLIALFAVLDLAACQGANLVRHGEQGALQLEVDEQRLWSRSLEEQRRLDRSGKLYEEPELAAYLNEVTQKIVPEDVRRTGLTFQIKIIKNPLLNAFAFPNGVIYVHTGILAKIENESQLATLLGHEMNHTIHRHATKNMRNVKNTTAVLASAQAVAAPFGKVGAVAGLLGTVGAVAAVTGYSRSMEAEADREGLDFIVQAGYDPQEAPKLFEHLKRDVEEEKRSEPFFFGSHPRLQDRIDSYSELLGGPYAGKGGETFVARFQEKTLPLVLENAQLELSIGRYGQARRDIERVLLKRPRDSQAHFYLGELYRQRNEAGDSQNAKREFMRAAELQPSYAEPHRALGYLYLREGKKNEAKAEFEQYLTLSPRASDRAYIEQYIQAVSER